MTRNRQETAERLIEAGFRVLAEEGFAAFGVNGVARAAGCDKKLIYRYFDGLDGLMEAMGREVAEGLVAALAPALEPPPASYAEMIERLALALLERMEADPRQRQIRVVELVADAATAGRFRAARGQVLGDWIRQARGGLAPPEGVDAPALNAVLIAAVEGIALSGAPGLGANDGPRLRAAVARLVRRAYGEP